MSETAKRLIIAAGGTGGHMFPAQALAETMLARGWQVELSTDARGARYTSGFPDATQINVLSSATFARGGVLSKLAVLPRIAGGVIGAVMSMLRDRPDVVVGFGGYPAIPSMAAAWLLRIPRMIHEQNGVLGRVNQIFAPRVDAVACGTWPTQLPNGVTGSPTGNPVRAAVLKRAAAPYDAPSDTHGAKIVIIGGSQGARILSEVVPAAIAELPNAVLAGLDITQQARPEDADAVRAAYARIGLRARVESFIEDVPDQFAAAQLVISRAGASTLADITVIGRPAILVPYAAAASDHQTANAQGLVEAGGAILMPERLFTASALAENISLVLENAQGAARMAEAARKHGHPDAASKLADLVEALASKGA